MGNSRYYLGIDNGGTLSKAALFDGDGRELAQANKKTELLMPHPGFTERNMAEMWEATAAVAASPHGCGGPHDGAPGGGGCGVGGDRWRRERPPRSVGAYCGVCGWVPSFRDPALSWNPGFQRFGGNR